MVRLKATKTRLYKLVAEYMDNLPPMRSVQFVKYQRKPDYALEWVTTDGHDAHAFFAATMGRPILSVEIHDREAGKMVSRRVYNLELKALRERGMVEEIMTAAERRRIQHCEEVRKV